MNEDIHDSNRILTIVVYGLILFTVLSKLLPHPYNFTSMGALSLFAGAFLSARYAWSAPIFCLIVSDAVGGFYNPTVMIFVYLGFFINTFVGIFLLRRNRSFIRLTGCGFIAAFIFYIISNFGMWLSGLGYPMTIQGLIECYINGLPYLKHTITGNIIYSYFLFGTYQIIFLLHHNFHSNTSISN